MRKFIYFLLFLMIISISHATTYNAKFYVNDTYGTLRKLYITCTNTQTSWDTAHDATSSSYNYTSILQVGSALNSCGAGFSSGADISRAFLVFNTTNIPTNALITSAKFRFYVDETNFRALGRYGYMALVNSTRSSVASLTRADYDNFGTTLFSKKWNFSTSGRTIPTDSKNKNYTINLTTAGLNAITKGGMTQMALLEGHDIEDAIMSATNTTNIVYLLNDTFSYNRYFLNITYVIDVNDPTLTVANQTNEYRSAFSYTPFASDVDTSIDKYRINDSTYFQINSGTGQITNKTLLPLGTLWLRVWVNDTFGNEANRTFKVVVQDTTSPTLTVANQTNEFHSSFSYTPSASDAGVGVSKYRINDSTYFQINSGTGQITNKTLLPLGTLWLRVWVNDTSGNEVNKTFKVVTNNTPPTWNFTITNQTVDYPNRFIYDLNASDSTGIAKYKFNGSSMFSINALTGVITNNTLLTPAIRWLTVSVNDTYGSRITSSFKVTVRDVTPPTISYTSPTGTPYTTVSNIPLIGNITDDISVDRCWYNITNDVGGIEKSTTYLTNCAGFSTTFTVSGGNDDYILKIRSNDTTGNKNTTTIFFTVNVPTGGDGGDSGGGGGGNTAPEQNATFRIVVWNFEAEESRQVTIKPSNEREYCLDVISKTTESAQSVSIRCELPENPVRDDICDWITFDRTEIELQPSTELREKVCLTIKTPADIVLGEQFVFNVKGMSNIENLKPFRHPVTLFVADYSQFLKNYWSIFGQDTLSKEINESLSIPNLIFPLILFNQAVMFAIIFTITKKPLTWLFTQLLFYFTIGVASMFYFSVMLLVTVLGLITLIYVRVRRKK